jgi:assimilatory nitrate reductase catalytic subunit
VLKVRASDEVMPAQAFLPMHWGGQQMNGLGANALTTGAFDPVSKQPELKHAAVKVEKLALPWRLVMMRRGCDTLRLLEALQPMLARFDQASCGLFGRADGMVVLRAACAEAPPQALIDELDALMGITEDVPCLTYRDARRGISKRVVVEAGRVTGVRLVGETLATEWLKEVMTHEDFPEDVRLWALAPVTAPPNGKQGRGRIVCSCKDVAESEIKALLQQGAGLEQLQAQLQCGTECGSCVPELKHLLEVTIPVK